MIRTAHVRHITALRWIIKRASLSNEVDRATLLAHPELLELSDRSVRERRTRLAVSDGQIVSFATFVDADTGLEVDDLFVEPDQMRRGVDTKLIGDLARAARGRGHGRMTVIANPHAVRLYEVVGLECD